MRIFVAIELPEAICEAIGVLQMELGAGRIVQPDNLHLTLAFLGEIEPFEAEQLHEALEEVDWGPGPEVALAGLEVFGSAERPEALVLSARPDAELARWHSAVMGAARGVGLVLARRRFRPHVTLARFRKGAGPGELARLGQFLSAQGDVALAPFHAGRLAMVRSTLGHGAPRHESLAYYGPDAQM
ncbi:RNA 2',3'-cyclic phosphodiesterase [Thioclava pacifica]|uniref:RNA 2',3'-cyclic phosphodiesterase n=1 Tax=Thioclava pacifica DSM 10166 TaxID=1353537 RepID=A0A074K4L9_9RHOB|nr:RNA 2',3'-cyclic phosphodiesterase [Thioclava pacifica]KEO56522.1 hypothetical protein TP2_03055 [Thioclava pacifica DSM 10166]